MEFSERLKIVIKRSRLKREEFAEKAGKSRTQIFKYLGGEQHPTADFFQAVKVAFPWVNIEWLITGVGTMEATTINDPGGQYQADGATNRRLEILLDNFAHLSEEDKQALERMAFALAQSTVKGKKRR